MDVVCFVDFYLQIRSMASRSLARVALMFAGMLAFLTAITFNALSGFGPKSGDYLAAFFVTARRETCEYKRACVFVRRFPSEHGGGGDEVRHPHNPCPLGPVHLGLHLSLDLCHVLVLHRGTLQKVPTSP